MGTLQGLYDENTVGRSSCNFADIVVIGERIESGIMSGKIIGGNNRQQSAARKPPSGYEKKKKEETTVVKTSVPLYQALMAPVSYFPYPYVAAAQFQQQSF